MATQVNPPPLNEVFNRAPLSFQDFNQSQNVNMVKMMDNLKLESEQNRQQMAQLVDAMKTMPPPQGL